MNKHFRKIAYFRIPLIFDGFPRKRVRRRSSHRKYEFRWKLVGIAVDFREKRPSENSDNFPTG